MAEVRYAPRRHAFGHELGRWSLRGRFDWREWDGEFVVRHDDTGNTYHLSMLAGLTFKALREGAAQVDEVAARVSSNSPPQSAATAALVAAFTAAGGSAHNVLAVLRDFESLGLARADFA